MTRAVIPGSFDPPTLGHYDLAIRAAKIFDEVYVVAFANGAKRGRFSDEERLEMLNVAFEGKANIRADLSSGLLADYCREHEITAIVKGARGTVDFDYELSLSLINRSIGDGIDTVILPSRAELMHVSSTMVSELIKYGKDYSPYVPDGVASLIKKYVHY